MGIYLFIFVAKVLENGIATLRLIVVANGKKVLGAFLNLVMSLIWVISTGLVVVNITKDPLKIIFFALGSFVGSYVGSRIEEKIAIGSNMLFVITKPIYTSIMKEKLEQYTSYIFNDINQSMMMIMVSRKKRKEILPMIRNIDQDAIIISEVARQLVFK